jgi:hypothetical protein
LTHPLEVLISPVDVVLLARQLGMAHGGKRSARWTSFDRIDVNHP